MDIITKVPLREVINRILDSKKEKIIRVTRELPTYSIRQIKPNGESIEEMETPEKLIIIFETRSFRKKK